MSAQATDRRQARRKAVRTFNRLVLNPAMLRFAGRRHCYAAAIRHTGRSSGRAYVTPVVADRAGDLFIIPLPYGTGVDWLRNVLAAGRATIESGGRTYRVTAPEVVDATVAWPLVPPGHRRTWRTLGIDEYLQVKVAED